MANVNLSAILDRPASTVEPPKAAPVGHYLCTILGLPREDVSSKKKTPYYEYSFKVLAASDDVEQDALNEFLTRADGTKKTLGEVVFKEKYYLTEAALFRLTELIEHCGVDTSDDSVTLRQHAQSLGGCQVLVGIKHEASEDGKSIYANVADTAPAE